MDFKDSLKQLSERIEKLKGSMSTEEATKNGLIMPFINALGYDVFNPLEVVPELDCDLIKKKGEKIDYAIMRDGEPVMLFECKHWQQNLDLHSTQLQKYFVASNAKFGILTNGIIYRFYTDIEKPNIMDDKPFLEVNMLDLKDMQIEELKKFHKSYFDLDNILSSASELKYMHELKNAIAEEFAEPSEEIVRHFGKQVYDGIFTAKLVEQFSQLVRRAIASQINDMIQDRLKAAISDTPMEEKTEKEAAGEDESGKESKIVTTEEELEAFYIVKSILRHTIPAKRVTYRDAQSYFAIFIDDNNRKTVCRLYLNSPTRKRIVFLDDNKNEIAHKMVSIDDIYSHADTLTAMAAKFL